MKTNKDELRKFYLNKRRDLSRDYIAENQQIIDQKAINYIKEKQPKNIVIYYPIKGENEVDTNAIISYCLDNNIKVYLPKWNHEGMNFYRIDKLSDLISTDNYYMPQENNLLNDTVDIAFIPLVAIDKDNNRIGYGAGYYDKWIADNEDKIKNLVGLAWDKQLVKEGIANESHDKPLDCVIIN